MLENGKYSTVAEIASQEQINESYVSPVLRLLAESIPGYESSDWFGIGAPKGTPADIIETGAALISVAAPLAQELTQVGPALGAITVCLIAVFNGLGRLFWGTLSDRIGRAPTFMALFLMQTAAFALLPASGHFTAFLVPVAVIALCYGGGFGTMPAFATDVFGAKNTGAIYGAMLTAWSAGAVAGPLLIAATSYRTALPLIAAMLAAATVLPLAFVYWFNLTARHTQWRGSQHVSQQG